MPRLANIKIVCDSCRRRDNVETRHNGVVYDPPGWSYDSDGHSFCPACSPARLDGDEVAPPLPEQVLKAARAAATVLQALMTTELLAQIAPSQGAMVLGNDGAARRMKRIALLSNASARVLSLYDVFFTEVSEAPVPNTQLSDAVRALEGILAAELAFPSRGVSAKQNVSRLAFQRDRYYSSEAPPIGNIDGSLSRIQEVAETAQKFAQLAATRAGEVTHTDEDDVLEAAFNDGIWRGRNRGPVNDAVELQRQVVTMLQTVMEREEKKQQVREAREVEPDDPVVVLQRLLRVREQLVAAGRTESVRALDVRIGEAELALAEERSNTVQGALLAEGRARDVTPKFTGAPGTIDAPPDADELEHLRRNHGDEAVDAAFPGARQ